MHWMEFILVVYYLLYPVWTVVAGTGSSSRIFPLPEKRVSTKIHDRSNQVRHNPGDLHGILVRDTDLNRKRGFRR